MNPFVTRISKKSWEVPVASFSLVLGAMIYFAWITVETRNERLPLLGPDQRSRIAAGSIDLQEEYRKLSAEVGKLRESHTKLENALASEGKQATVLNEQLQQMKKFAGLTEVEGPGLTITLRDSTRGGNGLEALGQIVHDGDVLRVVNELWGAGAEAITVNGMRVVTTTSFRCVGPVIHVQGVPIASPVIIRAIGDPDTLLGAMNLPGGVLAEIRETDPVMVQLETVEKHRFAAFTGPTTSRFVKAAKSK